MRKLLFMLLAMATLFGLLAGCGGKPETPAQTTAGSTTGTTQATTSMTTTLPDGTLPPVTLTPSTGGTTVVPPVTLPTNTSATTTLPVSSTPLTSWSNLTTPPPSTPSTTAPEAYKTKNGCLIVNDSIMEIYGGYSDEGLNYYADVINKTAAALPDVQVYAMFCPTAIEFNAPEKYQISYTARNSQFRVMNYIYSRLDQGIVPVDTWSALYDHQDEYLFFRMDHHWTGRAAYYAYTAFCEAAGLPANRLSDYQTGRVEDFIGYLYYFKDLVNDYPQIRERMLQNPDYVEYFYPLNSSKMTVYKDATLTGGYNRLLISDPAKVSTGLKSARYSIFLGGDSPLIHIVSDTVKNGRVLMISKESYGNALVPFLTDHFQEIYAIDPREFGGTDEPKMDLVQFCKDHNVTDFLFVNRAFSAGKSDDMKSVMAMLPQ